MEILWKPMKIHENPMEILLKSMRNQELEALKAPVVTLKRRSSCQQSSVST